MPAPTNSSNSQFSLRLESSTNTEDDRIQISLASSQASLASADYSEREEDSCTPIDSTSESQLISIFPGQQQTPATINKKTPKNKL